MTGESIFVPVKNTGNQKAHKYVNMAVLYYTFTNVDNQVGGQFDINRFYKEIAIGTIIGLRLNLNVLIIRLDAAKRVYDPAKEESNRWTFFTERLRGNSGIYFAIGYPF